MSATPTLSAHQLFQSHLVNCNLCRRYNRAEIREVEPEKYDVKTSKKSRYTGPAKQKLCRVGAILLSKALKEDPDGFKKKRRFFPFVAKINQVVLFRIGTEWKTGRVIEKSISGYSGGYVPGEKYIPSNGEPMGYEVEDKAGTRFYVNRNNIKPIDTLNPTEENHVETGRAKTAAAIARGEKMIRRFVVKRGS